MGRKWYSDTAGLIAAFITAAAPMRIAYAREARMYAIFQFVFLLFVFAFFQGFETRATGSVQGLAAVQTPGLVQHTRMFDRRCSSAQLSWSDSPVIFTTSSSWAFSALRCKLPSMAVIAATVGRRRRCAPDKYIGATVLMSAAGISYALATDFFHRYVSTYMPAWAVANASPWYWCQRSVQRIRSFCLPSSSAPHSHWTERTRNLVSHVLLAGPARDPQCRAVVEARTLRTALVPLMFILFGVTATAVVRLAYDALFAWVGDTLSRRWRRLVATTITALAAGFLLAFMPWLRSGLLIPGRQAGAIAGLWHDHHWRAATQFLTNRAGPSDVIIASAPALALVPTG